MYMRKIIVTGGAGFIGSHIVDLLLENNYEVHVIYNLLTGKKENINERGSLRVLGGAREAKIKRLIYAASSSAYGDQEKFPLIEDMQGRPLSPYGLQKYTGELMCRLFSDIYGLETVSLRYFNVYGPRASDEGAYALVIAKFLKQRKEGTALTIVPDGNQSRAYTHVKDVARANFSKISR